MMLLLQLALGFMVLPVFLQAVHSAIFYQFALADFEIRILIAFFISAFLCLGDDFSICLSLNYTHIHVTFTNSINFIKRLSLCYRFQDFSILIGANLPISPECCQLRFQSIPVLLLSNLSNPKYLNFLLLVESTHFDAFEVYLCKDLIRLVNKRDIVPLYFNTSISFLEEQPTPFGQNFEGSSWKNTSISIVLLRPRIIEHIKHVIDQLKLSNRSWMPLLFLKFLRRTGEFLPVFEPSDCH